MKKINTEGSFDAYDKHNILSVLNRVSFLVTLQCKFIVLLPIILLN